MGRLIEAIAEAVGLAWPEATLRYQHVTIEDEQMRESGHQHSTAAAFVAREVVAFRTAVQSVPITPEVSARPFESSSHRTHSIELSNWMAMRDVAAMMRRWTFHATHPRHFGLFVAAVVRRGGACENRLPPALGAREPRPSAVLPAVP